MLYKFLNLYYLWLRYFYIDKNFGLIAPQMLEFLILVLKGVILKYNYYIVSINICLYNLI